tara:strand:+ start:2542 stop:2787 length:246 start_codon:yes stop_codon:yes gene_type:complete
MEEKIDIILIKLKRLEKTLDQLKDDLSTHRMEHSFSQSPHGGGGMPMGGGGPAGGMPVQGGPPMPGGMQQGGAPNPFGPPM